MATPLHLDFTTLDVFTSTKYLGNPLAVVSLPPSHHDLPQHVKQTIAREFNLSETVFLHEPADPSETVRTIDIFTVDGELPFAGHPTIGSAGLLLRELGLSHVESLITKAGPIKISLSEDGARVRAAIPHAVHIHSGRLASLPRAKELAATGTLGYGDPAILEAELMAPPVSIVRGMTFLPVKLPSLEHLAKVTPGRHLEDENLDGLLDEGPWRESRIGRYFFVEKENGTIQTRNIDFVVEDPATGSAACTLACYLTLQSAAAGVTTPLVYNILQGVEMGRRSDICVEVTPGVDAQGQPEIQEVFLGGTAVVVMSGKLSV